MLGPVHPAAVAVAAPVAAGARMGADIRIARSPSPFPLSVPTFQNFYCLSNDFSDLFYFSFNLLVLVDDEDRSLTLLKSFSKNNVPLVRILDSQRSCFPLTKAFGR